MNLSTQPKSDPVALCSLRTLHLFTLSGFAIAQPALTSLTGQSVYLHDQQFGMPEMLVLLALLMIVIPSIWVALDQIVQRIAIFFRCPGRNLFLGLLMGIVVLSVTRPYISAFWFTQNGVAGYTGLALAIVSAVAFALFYDRIPWLRTWLTIASVGLLVFPANFLVQFDAILREETLTRDRFHAKTPVPVFFIVFDEFSGISLFNSDNEIDALRFPQFARLASMSTWYRNATTVNPRTDIAVPAILSGQYPTSDRNPLASQYPGNLLQVIKSTEQFEMSVFEPVSRLCPDSVRYIPKPDRSFQQKCFRLVHTLAAVYPRLILGQDTPIDFPRIPKEWFGLSESIDAQWEEFSQPTKGLFHYPGPERRKDQQSHFLRCLEPADLPRFTFMHTVFPHFPWCFLPSGELYMSEFAESTFPFGGGGELGEDWCGDLDTVLRSELRYRLQLGFADRFIGQVLDRLEETEQLDNCLLIVMADHGVSFRPGNSRRLPGTDNLADILSVPLFIKFPGQTAGQSSDRNVESVDLFPTIAEVLGIETSTAIDGISVLQDAARPRKTVYFQGNMSIIEPGFPQRWSAIKRQAELYQTKPIEQISDLAYRYPEWNGRPLDSFEIDKRSIPYTYFRKDSDYDVSYRTANLTFSPNLVWGSIASDELPYKSADILLAVDGVVIDSMRTIQSGGYQNHFQFMIPPQFLEGKKGEIELFVVNTKDKHTSLIPLVCNEILKAKY